MPKIKFSLALSCLLVSSSLYAIPIESRTLSQQSTDYSTTPTAIPVGAQDISSSPIAVNPTWQIMQKSDRLESDIRQLRGIIEEQQNEITQLKNELQNRYTDLDQRLELLLQKIDPEAATTTEDNQQDTTPSTPTS